MLIQLPPEWMFRWNKHINTFSMSLNCCRIFYLVLKVPMFSKYRSWRNVLILRKLFTWRFFNFPFPYILVRSLLYEYKKKCMHAITEELIWKSCIVSALLKLIFFDYTKFGNVGFRESIFISVFLSLSPAPLLSLSLSLHLPPLCIPNYILIQRIITY